ncbi:MAG TPA: PEP-CTERM sorting domain-containing protein [Longimicrobium sp.]|jgi:hypothetical protein
MLKRAALLLAGLAVAVPASAQGLAPAGGSALYVSTGSFLPEPEQLYLSFLSAPDVYGGPGISFTAHTGHFSPLSLTPWDIGGTGEDAFFQPQLIGDPALQNLGTTTTPEPVSMALLGTGLAGLAVARRRKRKS